MVFVHFIQRPPCGSVGEDVLASASGVEALAAARALHDCAHGSLCRCASACPELAYNLLRDYRAAGNYALRDDCVVLAQGQSPAEREILTVPRFWRVAGAWKMPSACSLRIEAGN